MYVEQNRPDLAKIEEEELAVIETFLPKQLSESEITDAVQAIMNTGERPRNERYGQGDGYGLVSN